MKVIEPGHIYELENFENDGTPNQVLEFIHKESDDGVFKTMANGTTNEELLKVLIDRLEFLNAKMQNKYNVFAIKNLWAALFYLESRTNERIIAGTEGTPNE